MKDIDMDELRGWLTGCADEVPETDELDDWKAFAEKQKRVRARRESVLSPDGVKALLRSPSDDPLGCIWLVKALSQDACNNAEKRRGILKWVSDALDTVGRESEPQRRLFDMIAIVDEHARAVSRKEQKNSGEKLRRARRQLGIKPKGVGRPPKAAGK